MAGVRAGAARGAGIAILVWSWPLSACAPPSARPAVSPGAAAATDAAGPGPAGDAALGEVAPDSGPPPADVGTATDSGADADLTTPSDGTAATAPDTGGPAATDGASDAAVESSDAQPETGEDVGVEAGPTPLGCPATPAADFGLGWPKAPAGPVPPDTSCAKPGWPGQAAPHPLTFAPAAASLGLEGLPPVERCVLAADFDGDGGQDLGLVLAPLSPGAPRVFRLLRKTGPGQYMAKDTALPGALQHQACARADLDDDGDEDVVVGGESGLHWLRNDGGGFKAQSFAVSPAPLQIVAAVAPLDVDRDGDLDLAVAQVAKPKPASVWMAPCACGPADPPYTQCVGGFCTGGEFVYRILRNDGATWAWSAPLPAIDGDPWSLTVHDLDRDGWPDLFVGAEWGGHGWLHNAGSGWQLATTEIGMRPWAHIMGSAVEDFDKDGVFDLFAADYGVDTAYRGVKGGPFHNASAAWGVWGSYSTKVTWATVAADFDSDGWIDLAATNSGVMTADSFWIEVAPGKNPFSALPGGGHQVWHNHGGTFKATILPHPPAFKPVVWPTVVAAVDLDGDGDRDVVDVLPDLKLRAWRNDTPQGHFLGVRVVSTASAPGGAGALIEVWANGFAQLRAAGSGRGMAAEAGVAVHIGLGAVAKVDLLRVWWPSGAQVAIPAPPIDTTVAVVEPAGGAP